MDISNLLEVEVSEIPPLATSISENTIKTPVSLKPSQIISHDETVFFNNFIGNDIAQIRFRRLHCTACDAHIGSAPFDVQNMHEHPILKTLLCSSCRIFYGDGEFEQGDDATDMFCRWCANGGNLYCCSYCSNTFCDKCIKRNFDLEIRKKIEADEKWRCFVCDPKDLYTHRAICRALLQHVRTLARIFMTDHSMSQQEIESRMELDDSKCCLGRRFKRKRQNSDSNDDDDDDDDDNYDDDEDYDENRDESYSSRSRKKSKSASSGKRHKSTSSITKEKTQATVNGTSRFIPIAPKYIIQDVMSIERDKSDEPDDLRPPLLCEQTMIECENQTVTSQGIVVPATNYVRSKIPDSILNNSAISLNPIPKRNVIHTTQTRSRPIAIRPLHKVNTIPSGAKVHRLPSNAIHSNSIVTIPVRPPILTIDTSKSTLSNSASQSGSYLRCKDLTKTLNVIHIDSDSEETSIKKLLKTQPNKNNRNKNSECVEENVSSFVSTRKINFQEAINNPLKKVDDLLQVFRQQLELDFKTMERIPDNEVVENRKKIKIINENIENIVNELTSFNNVMVSKLKPWKKAHLNGKTFDDSTKIIVLNKHERSNKLTTLDMECVRDSEPDDECDDDHDIDMNSLLDFSQKIKKIIDVKDYISQGTLTKIQTEDKAVQCYNISKEVDFDKSIGYSLLMKADYNDKENKEIYKPVVIHDKNFGKYEEQFIFYLQYLEDCKNLSDDKRSEKMKECTLIDLIDADLEGKKSLSVELNDNQLISAKKAINSIPSEKLHNNDENLSFSKSANNFNENKNSFSSKKQSNDSKEVTKRRKRKDSHEVKDNDETVIAVNSLIDDENGINRNNWENISNDDECTILE